MTNDELIKHCKISIKECDTLKDKYRGANGHFRNEHLATLFEGMSEAYCDILNRALGRDFSAEITKADLEAD